MYGAAKLGNQWSRHWNWFYVRESYIVDKDASSQQNSSLHPEVFNIMFDARSSSVVSRKFTDGSHFKTLRCQSTIKVQDNQKEISYQNLYNAMGTNYIISCSWLYLLLRFLYRSFNIFQIIIPPLIFLATIVLAITYFLIFKSIRTRMVVGKSHNLNQNKQRKQAFKACFYRVIAFNIFWLP